LQDRNQKSTLENEAGFQKGYASQILIPERALVGDCTSEDPGATRESYRSEKAKPRLSDRSNKKRKVSGERTAPFRGSRKSQPGGEKFIGGTQSQQDEYTTKKKKRGATFSKKGMSPEYLVRRGGGGGAGGAEGGVDRSLRGAPVST